VTLQHFHRILEEMADVGKEVKTLLRVSRMGYPGFHLALRATNAQTAPDGPIPHVGNDGYHFGSDFCATLHSVDYAVGNFFTLNRRFVFRGEVVPQVLLYPQFHACN